MTMPRTLWIDSYIKTVSLLVRDWVVIGMSFTRTYLKFVPFGRSFANKNLMIDRIAYWS